MSFATGNEKIDKYLDELADEYKKLLFSKLLEHSTSVEDLSVSELLRIDSEIKKPLLIQNSKQLRKKRTLFLAGIAYMLIAILFYLTYEIVIKNRLDVIALASMVVGATGFCISLFSFFYSKFPMKVHADSVGIDSHSMPPLMEYQVIQKWRDIEGIANDLSSETSRNTPRSAIQYLHESRYITDDEENQLRNFLKMRNEIVHNSNANLSPKEMKSSIEDIEKIIHRLKNTL